MSKADRYRRIAERTRRIPGEHGLRPYRVFVVNASRSGAFGLEGTETTTETELLEHGQPPKVRILSNEQLALAGLDAGTLEVGPITPTYPGGGTALETITGSSLAARAQLRFRVAGPEYGGDGSSGGALFRLSNLDSSHAIHYTLTLSPIADE